MSDPKNTRRDEVLSELKARFPGTLSISPGKALVAAGLTKAKNPENAARVAIYRNTFPFRYTRTGRHRCVLLTDLADHMVQSVEQ